MKFFKSVLFQIYLELVLFSSVIFVLSTIIGSFFKELNGSTFNSENIFIFGAGILFINLLIIFLIKYLYGDSNTQKYDIRDIANHLISFFTWFTFLSIVSDIFRQGFDLVSLYYRLFFFITFGLTSYFVLIRNKLRLIEYIKNVESIPKKNLV